MSEINETNLGIVEEHFEEITFLWNHWTNARGSADFTLRDVRTFERRIEAHASALQAYRPEGPSYVEALLKSEVPGEVSAAACWLLRYKSKNATELVFKALLENPAPAQKRAIVEAIARAGDGALVARVLDLKAGDNSDLALLQLRLAATQNATALKRLPLAKLLSSPELPHRVLAWQSVLHCARAVTPEQTLAGALDENAGVRRPALFTAAWGAQPWVLDHCRRAAAQGVPDHEAEMELLSILGDEKDATLIAGLTSKPELGPRRFCWLGMLGRAAFVPTLIAAMSLPDPASASLAGATFTRITGRTLRVTGKAVLPTKDGSTPDEFEKEFLEEIPLYDAQEAAQHWQETQDNYQANRRYSQGCVVPDAPPFSPDLDIVSVREACLRAAFAGKPGPSAADLERFPLELA